MHRHFAYFIEEGGFMVSVFRVGLLLAVVALVAGCSSGEVTAPPATGNEMVAESKARTEAFVTKARQNPQAAPAELQMLIETLEGSASQTGEATAPLISAAKELQALYQKSAPKAQTDEQLQKVADAAAALLAG
jgi:hypothetical protein